MDWYWEPEVGVSWLSIIEKFLSNSGLILKITRWTLKQKFLNNYWIHTPNIKVASQDWVAKKHSELIADWSSEYQGDVSRISLKPQFLINSGLLLKISRWILKVEGQRKFVSNVDFILRISWWSLKIKPQKI